MVQWRALVKVYAVLNAMEYLFVCASMCKMYVN